MTLRPLSLAACALALLLNSVHGAETKKASDNLDLRYANGIVAVVEDKAITVEEVRRELTPLVAEIQRSSRTQEEFEQRLEAAQADVVQSLIDRVLIVKEFRKDEKKKIPASYVDNRIAEMQVTEFGGDRSKFLAYLHQRGKTQAEFRVEIEEDIIYGYMRGQMRKSTSMVSPVKIQTYYNENKDKFFREDEVHLRLIQLNRANLTDTQLREKAEAIYARIAGGEKFEDVARETSQDTRRVKGGDWGWVRRNDLRKEFIDQLFTLKKAEFTRPIVLNEGAYLLYVEDRHYAGVQEIDSVRDDIERILVAQMTREAQEKWLERLRRNGYVKYY